MFFSSADSNFRILTVTELNCTGRNVEVAPRPFHALSYRFRGGAAFIGSDYSTVCKGGDLAFVPAGVSYGLRYENKQVKEHMIVIHFEYSGEPYDRFEIFSPKNSEIFADLFSRLYRTWRFERNSTVWGSMACFYEILCEMAKQFFANKIMPEEMRIKQAVEHLEAHFTDPSLTVEKLCEIAGLCDTQFRKLFAKVYHTTPLKRLNHLRVEYAAMLLRDTVLKVDEICDLSGFTDTKYFSTVFKKYKQASPSQYRKNNRFKIN